MALVTEQKFNCIQLCVLEKFNYIQLCVLIVYFGR
jgi:hypothetical protein